MASLPPSPYDRSLSLALKPRFGDVLRKLLPYVWPSNRPDLQWRIYGAFALMIAAPVAAQRPALTINGYGIDAEIDTATHHLAAKTVVSFTAPENAEQVSFGFHPALKVTKIFDEAGALLTGERLADGSIRITPPAPFAKGQVQHWTFEYEGTITGNDDGPI